MSNEEKAKAVVNRLRMLKYWPSVPPKEWRVVYKDLGFGDMGSSSSKVYNEIKNRVKYAKVKVMRRNDPRQLEQLAAAKEATQQSEGEKFEALEKALAVETTRR